MPLIQKVDIQVAISIEVQQRQAGPHTLNQEELSVAPIGMNKVDARLGRDIGQNDALRSRLCRGSSRDRNKHANGHEQPKQWETKKIRHLNGDRLVDHRLIL